MQKTRIGISAGMLAAAIYFLGLFSGMLTALILVGYVLMFEDNGWLRKNALRAMILMILFSLITAVIGFIPSMISFVNNVFSAFGSYFTLNFVSRMIDALLIIINSIEKLLFIILGFVALSQKTFFIPIIDQFIDKHGR